jgi:hypothetical protein
MKKRHRKQRLKKLGVCRICAPMLQHKAATGATLAAINCPACARTISLDALSERAVDCLLLCMQKAGVCLNGMRRMIDGEVERDSPCQCDKQHLSLEGRTASEPTPAMQTYWQLTDQASGYGGARSKSRK